MAHGLLPQQAEPRQAARPVTTPALQAPPRHAGMVHQPRVARILLLAVPRTAPRHAARPVTTPALQAPPRRAGMVRQPRVARILLLAAPRLGTWTLYTSIQQSYGGYVRAPVGTAACAVGTYVHQ